ncbi:hypothetical protein GDO81_018634 [Engystomops pustulosus]|uniref:Mucin-7-like n=1 Tax=Engystomops pustulosus TaxID=76066 RepID=A0AAV6YTS2_ENGPU|nr:hypothetical protein GDO81_018634 [Engystomops pustulosus]
MLHSAAPLTPPVTPSPTPKAGKDSPPLTPFTLSTTTLLTPLTLAGPATTLADKTTSASSGTRDGGPPAAHRPEGTPTCVTLVPSTSSVADVILLFLEEGRSRR